MDYFNRDLIEATLDQVTKSQQEVLGWEAVRIELGTYEKSRWFSLNYYLYAHPAD
jgi:hypothetical protein